MNIYKVLPDLKRKRQMNLWQKALRSQWSAEDLNWDAPQRITQDKLKDQLAKVLTPILMGEQSALYSVSGLIPIMGHHGEQESQFYLTTWAVDEARHTELFAKFYHRLGREPLAIRKFPAGYLFQSAIISKDAAEWLSGVLVSECLAKAVMEEFRRIDIDPVLSEISDGILEDEARHLAFNHIYMEERFCESFKKNPGQARTTADGLRARMTDVFAKARPMLDSLAPEIEALGVDREAVLARVAKDARERLDKAVAGGERLAAQPAAAVPSAAGGGK